jgi:hypothetical protein
VDLLISLIGKGLSERKFCRILEAHLGRVWPSEKLRRLEREKEIHAFAKAHGWTAEITDPGLRVVFKRDSDEPLQHALHRDLLIDWWCPTCGAPMLKKPLAFFLDGPCHCPECKTLLDMTALSMVMTTAGMGTPTPA